jgi:hypothetical protein
VRERVGVGGVVAALSVTSDLTRGHLPGKAMRACLLATELARRAEVDGAAVYYATLLRFAGCAATSHEIAATFGGDDVVVRARGDLIDLARPAEALCFLLGLGRGAERVRILGRVPGAAKAFAEGARADCEVGAEVTRRLRLPEEVSRAVLDAFERFDGRGVPAGTNRNTTFHDVEPAARRAHTPRRPRRARGVRRLAAPSASAGRSSTIARRAPRAVTRPSGSSSAASTRCHFMPAPPSGS